MSDKSFIYGLIGGAIAGYLTRPKQTQAITQIIQTIQPQLPQVFDYVINLYTDKIEITDQGGSKTTLNTISELNEWLTRVTGKNIFIWNNGNMTGDFEPTSNRYVIMGKPTRFRTVLKSSDMDLYYFAYYLPDEEFSDSYISNFREYQLSNVNIFAIGQPIVI
jgi:gas vesicle protein